MFIVGLVFCFFSDAQAFAIITLIIGFLIIPVAIFGFLIKEYQWEGSEPIPVNIHCIGLGVLNVFCFIMIFVISFWIHFVRNADNLTEESASKLFSYSEEFKPSKIRDYLIVQLVLVIVAFIITAVAVVTNWFLLDHDDLLKVCHFILVCLTYFDLYIATHSLYCFYICVYNHFRHSW